MDSRVALFVSVTLALTAASAHAQAGPHAARSARAVRMAGRDRAECRLTEPMATRPRRSYYLPWLDGRELLAVPPEAGAFQLAQQILPDVPEH